MAIELDVRKLGLRLPAASATAVTANDVVLPRSDRISLSLRRRRQRRLLQALETAAWVAGGLVLLLFAGAGILSLH